MDKQLEAQVDSYIDEVWDSVLGDIAELVSHPSVADYSAAEPGAPFGPDARAALDCALGIAARLGYETSCDEGYIGIADIPGERPGQVATIAHCDVVPAGPGWNTDPFRMERREGWLLGRGVIDDKGPAVLSLYAGAYLLRQGITPRYTFRALLGSDEEVGMTDVHHYLETHEDPLFLFTPDADFPVCNAEKGFYGGVVKSAPIHDGRIISWSGAEASNAIPGQSVLELAIDASELPAPRANADRIVIEPAGEGRSRIMATGIGGHASLPEGTINAIGLVTDYLLELLDVVPGALSEDEAAFIGLMDLITEDTTGEALGIASSSEMFGPLTINAGVIRLCDGCFEQSIDVRYPESISASEVTSALSGAAARFGATFEVEMDKPPFYISAESAEVQTLIGTYNEVTGRHAEPFSMGGGTYARNFKRAVSFGPEELDLELPEWGGMMHGPNECANEAQLRQALKIYILAILRLMELEL